MAIAANLCTLAVRQVIGGVCNLTGFVVGEGAVEGVTNFLMKHFLDNSTRLTKALEQANERAWKALEVALAGDSIWDRCKLLLASGEDKAFRAQVRPFLDACPLSELHGRDGYRQKCLQELKAASKAGCLTGGALDPVALARQAGAFARFSDPQSLLNAESESLGQMGDDLRQAGYPNLAEFVALRPQRGDPLLVLAARYFFRRAVEDDSALFQGLSFAQMEAMSHAQDDAFRGLYDALTTQGERLEKILVDVQVVVTATHEVVLDVREEQQRQGREHREIYQAVLDLQNKLDLMNREVRPRDSLSIRGDGERALVKQLVLRYRDLPEERRRELPALLNALGKLEVAAGDFSGAQRDFASVAELVADPKAQAEAHFNAYRAALERREWDAGLDALREAVRLDRSRFTPFPMEKYQPRRILGAGGFGVAFLCRHKYMNADVVVKALLGDDLERGVDEVFAEAQTLRALDHPAIIRVQDCGCAGDDESRPYLVMDYFEGKTLEEAAREKPLTPDEMIAVARQVASGLEAAHARGILHRDVKPGNILLQRTTGDTGDTGKRQNNDRSSPVSPVSPVVQLVPKIIDFGLALRRTGRETMLASTQTVIGSSIAGTLEYAAPEQMGKLPGVAVGPASDVYGFARTCCYALFQTPQPLLRHWRSVPESLAALLETCLEERPENRPASFKDVLSRLASATPKARAVPLPVQAEPGDQGSVALSSKPVVEMTEAERREELAALAKHVAGCRRCTNLASSRSRTVFGEGRLDPMICFLGEAPGADEDRLGEPFVGAAGQVLNGLFRDLGLVREEMYVTNMLKCRPPGNRTPLPAEIDNCREFLDRQMELIRPKAICTLGGCASQNLLGSTETIGRLRGRLHEYRGMLVLCTYHPAFLLPGRSPEKRRDVLRDIVLLMRRLGLPIPRGF
jgi:uracil-DNA glycosylase family 4